MRTFRASVAAAALVLVVGFLPTAGSLTGGAVTAPATGIAGGKDFACALAPTGGIVCWGDDTDGQLDAPTGAFAAVTAGRYTAAP